MLFNTTCLVGADGVLSKYRKVNPWIPWELHASPHDLDGYTDDPFPVVDTELGKLGAARGSPSSSRCLRRWRMEVEENSDGVIPYLVSTRMPSARVIAARFRDDFNRPPKTDRATQQRRRCMAGRFL